MEKRFMMTLATVLAAVFMGSGTGLAQQIKVAYVDFVTFAMKSTRAQEEQKKFAEAVTAKRDAIEKKGNLLNQKKDELTKQGPMLKEETRNAKIKEIGILEMELKLEQEEAEKVLRNQQREAQEVFQTDVVKIIGDIRQQKGLTLVINSQALLSADDALNITDEVVALYDKATGAKPAAQPKPPQPKPPTPAGPGERKGPK